MNLRMIASCGLASMLFALGCGDSGGGGEGTVTFTTWGEDYIEAEIPSADFADGYSIHYDKFLVLIGNIVVADADGTVAARHDGFYLVNQVEKGKKELVSFDALSAGPYAKVSYMLAPAQAAEITAVGGVSTDDIQTMVDGQYHVYVEGQISKGGESKSFHWGFGVPTLDQDCEGELDGKLTEGTIVTEGGEDVIELTCHGDHLYYDDLQSLDAKRRGEAIFTADADDDGEITLEELDAVSLVDLPPDQYGTGGVGGIDTLGQFIRFLSRTIGHFRGEGECFLTDP